MVAFDGAEKGTEVAFAEAQIIMPLNEFKEDGTDDILGELDSLDLDTDLEDAVVVVEWGEGLAERLSDNHLDIRLERDAETDTRTATWHWSRA